MKEVHSAQCGCHSSAYEQARCKLLRCCVLPFSIRNMRVWKTTISTACVGARGKVGSCRCPPTVSDTVGLLWREREGGSTVCSTRLVRLTNLRDLPFYCTSTNPIPLTAGHYSSIAIIIYLYAVALSGSLAELKLCSPGSRPKPLNLHQWNAV